MNQGYYVIKQAVLYVVVKSKEAILPSASSYKLSLKGKIEETKVFEEKVECK